MVDSDRETGGELTPDDDDDEVGMVELFQILWSDKWVIASVTAAAALVSVIAVLILPNIYRAEALLAPNQKSDTGGLSALAAQYGGLASLAGVDLGGNSTDKLALGLEVLKSRKFISDFVDRRSLLVPLIAAEGWNPETAELEIAADEYDVAAGEWIRKVSPPLQRVPTSQEAYEEFGDIFSVAHDKTTGTVTIGIEHYSPIVAKQWVDWLVEDLNSAIRNQEVSEAEAAIKYLNEQIRNTPLSELKSVFFRLIEEQTKTVMLSRMSDEYFLKTLDPAVAPEKKHKPKRAIIVLMSILVGFFVAVSYAFTAASIRRRKRY